MKGIGSEDAAGADAMPRTSAEADEGNVLSLPVSR